MSEAEIFESTLVLGTLGAGFLVKSGIECRHDRSQVRIGKILLGDLHQNLPAYGRQRTLAQLGIVRGHRSGKMNKDAREDVSANRGIFELALLVYRHWTVSWWSSDSTRGQHAVNDVVARSFLQSGDACKFFSGGYENMILPWQGGADAALTVVHDRRSILPSILGRGYRYVALLTTRVVASP